MLNTRRNCGLLKHYIVPKEKAGNRTVLEHVNGKNYRKIVSRI
jgi:hypothetical protein